VKLIYENAYVLDRLRQLQSKNVRLIICSTCLNNFALTTNVKVSIVGGMEDILKTQTKAEKVITV
jgi:hypothetical protein